jgi:quercetin dioxygenase-like cupin family protein
MNKIQVKNIENADETRDLPKTKIEVVTMEDITVMRVTFQPGWEWSSCIKPTVRTDSCQVPHINYILSGQIKIIMDNGTEKDLKPGDVAVIEPGHDARVIGQEPCVALDFSGGKMYGKC